MKNRRLIIILLSSMAILLIPFIAMQFTAEVNWTTSDFLVAGFLLLGTGILSEAALRSKRKKSMKFAFISILLMGLVLVWAELAVGIFGSPIAGN